jgi:transcriptional regulator with XRE-family HTH domain
VQAAPERKPLTMKAGTAFLPGLKRVREKQHLSLKQLSDKAEVSKDTVWKLETLQRAAEQKTRRKLARALGVGIKELMKTEEVDNK